MSRFVQWPSVRGVSSSVVLGLLLVAFTGLSFGAILKAEAIGPCFTLTDVRGLRVDMLLGSAFHTPVLQLVGQAVTILRVVANDVLPFVAGIACDRVAVVFVEAAYAVYLAIVLLLEIIRVLLVSELRVVCHRAVDTPGEWLDVLTIDSGRPKEVCHAITSAFKVVVGGDGFR